MTPPVPSSLVFAGRDLEITGLHQQLAALLMLKALGDGMLHLSVEPKTRPIYNDLSRGHSKWWFSKGLPPKMALD